MSVLAWAWRQLSQWLILLWRLEVVKTEQLDPVEARMDMMVSQQEVVRSLAYEPRLLIPSPNTPEEFIGPDMDRWNSVPPI